MTLLLTTRKYKRYSIQLRVKLNSGSLSFWAITSDISKKGLRIRVNQEFPVNMVLHLEVIMPDGQVSIIKGIVRYVNETPQSERRFGVGIEILEDDTTFQDYLQDLEVRSVKKSEQITKGACTLSDMKKDVFENNTHVSLPSTIENAFDYSAREQNQNLHAHVQKDIDSKESNIMQPSDQLADKSQDPLSEKTTEKEVIGRAPVFIDEDIPIQSKRFRDGIDRIKVSYLLIIILVTIGIIVGGNYLYQNLVQGRKIQHLENLICSVQVGAFMSKANATIVSKNYQEKGYDVFIDKDEIQDKGIMYKVLVGPFKNIEDTSQFAMDLQAKEKTDAFVICK